MRESNETSTNVFIHHELEKLAYEERQWLTAARHLAIVIKLMPDSGMFAIWLELAECYDKAE